MTAHIDALPREPGSDQLMHTVVEAARILRVGRTTIYVLMNNGSLRGVHIGRSVRISRAELERYVAALDRSDRIRPVDNPESRPPAA